MQKRDTELKIIEGSHSNDLDHEVHNINLSQTDKPINPGPCHTCNGLPFIKDCNNMICLKCKPNLNKHSTLMLHLNTLEDAPPTVPFNHNTPLQQYN